MTARQVLLFVALCTTAHAASACPTDVATRAPGALLTVQLPGRPLLALTADDLAALPPARLTQTRSVAGASGGAATVKSLVYSGVLLRDVLAKAGAAADRGARTAVVDGVALSAAEGPLALRALADLRPGPRHVRNLCALVWRGP